MGVLVVTQKVARVLGIELGVLPLQILVAEVVVEPAAVLPVLRAETAPLELRRSQEAPVRTQQ